MILEAQPLREEQTGHSVFSVHRLLCASLLKLKMESFVLHYLSPEKKKAGREPEAQPAHSTFLLD